MNELREEVYQIHRLLLKHEARKQEKILERSLGPYDLWSLSVENEAFAWTRLVSAIIIFLDEELETKNATNPEFILQVCRELDSLFFNPQAKHEEFHSKFHEALNDEPELHIIRGKLFRSLKEFKNKYDKLS